MARRDDSTESVSFLSRLLQRLSSLVGWLLVAVLVLLALYAAIGRQLVQNIGEFRSQLEAELSEAVGYPVTIGELEGRWRLLDPVLEARELALAAPNAADAPLVRLDSLRIRLDTLSSLWRLRVVFEEFEADRLDLTLAQASSGRLHLDGLPDATVEDDVRVPIPADALTSGSQDWLPVLGRWLSDPAIRVTRVNLGLRTADQPVRHIEIPQLDLTYHAGLFSATGRAMRLGTTHQLASFNLLGRHFFRGDFTGQLYVDVNSGRLFDSLVSRYRWRGLGVEGFDAGGQAWLTFRDGTLEQLNGRLQVPFLQLRAQEESMAPVENLSLAFGWRGTVVPGQDSLLSGELHLQDVRWDWLGETVSGFNLRLKRRDGELSLQGQGVPVGPLARFSAGIGLLPVEASHALENYRPTGFLDDVSMRLPLADGAAEFTLQAQLRQVAVQPFDGAPALAGVNGQLQVGRDWGRVVLASDDLELGFPELFLDRWSFTDARAEVAWQLDGPLTRVWSEGLSLRYGEPTTPPGRQTELEGAFDLRLDQEGEDNLGLRVAVREGTADMLPEFVPARVIDAELYQWLATAIPEARIEEGVFYGHGTVSSGAPDYSFTSSMYYRFSDARVRYDSRWPEVTGVSGWVQVHDDRATVAVDRARSGGLALEPSRVELVPDGDELVLEVSTAADVTAPHIRHWLANSPLGELAGEAPDAIEVAGDYHLDLDLTLPLTGPGEPQVNARVQTGNGEVAHPDSGLVWQQLRGDVTYRTGEGIVGEPFLADLNGMPVTVGLEYREADDALVVSQSGSLSVTELSGLLELPASLDTGLAGRFNYTARLNLASDAAPGVSLYSSLIGLASDWPMPLGKTSDVMAPLQAMLDWTPEGRLQLAGVWQDRLAFRLAWQDGEFDRGQLAMGSEQAELPPGEGIEVVGRVEEVPIDAWVDRVERLTSSLSPSPPPSDFDPELVGPPRPEMAPATAGTAPSATVPADTNALIERWLYGIQLSVGQLRVLGQAFPELDVAATFSDGVWSIDTRSDRAVGELRLPMDKQQTVSVRFPYLRLASPEEETIAAIPAPLTSAEQVDAFRAMAMEGWPNISVVIDELAMDNRSLGRWSFLLVPDAKAVHVQSLSGVLGSLSFDGDLYWDIHDGRQLTRLQGDLHGQDLGDLAQMMGSEAPLRNEQTQLVLNLEWPGRPDEFTLTRLDGEVSVRLDEGVILERNNTALLFRLFNVLNADTLWRRLKLDFSDLYERGVAFDAISGTAELSDGTLSWAPELQIVGPSGAFKLSGSTDLVTETLDMRMVVVLPLTQNLPLAALLLGAAPPIGGALFVLDKVLGDPLSRLTSATYTVRGRWDNPVVELRNVFDTGD
ncbi:YhdP family protein [Marinobacter xestospongiae]|uniref:YhdP family protein n=1 Tax=Marinobacter xestospongiae TaxID=994319 RepID=UPI0020042C06|nr:YhdP family protein [Marinobacter xestospongiae]MCK7566994.1 TIGR02099 family protein [Marinobacter xestospongiae]